MASFNGTEGGPIPLPTAKQWTENYKKTIQPGEIRAHYFGGDVFQRLLSEDGSVGIRAYYAIDQTGMKQLILVAVNENGNDLLPSEGSVAAAGNGGNEPVIIDGSYPCPTYCSIPVVL